MRVLLNTSILRSPQTGIGNYVVELAGALQLDNTLHLDFFDGCGAASKPVGTTAKVNTRATGFFRQIPGAYQWRRYREQHHFNLTIKKQRPTLYHDPSLWPLQFDGPMVMTVHDLTHIAYAWTQPKARVREIERQLPGALQRAQRILVDSQFIADELSHHYDMSPAKIIVAPLAPSTHFYPRRAKQLAATLAKFELSFRRYFLFIGTLEPRKNLSSVLSAHAQLPLALRQRYPLIVIGGDGWLTHKDERALTAALNSGTVRRLGYIDRDDLADVLAGAKLFVFPSLYEGFGIPVLEAMASGVPVISSNAACLPEVGGDAVRYFNPSDQSGLTALMTEFIEDEAECERLSTAGIERSKLFSWEKCAAITAEAYRAAVSGH